MGIYGIYSNVLNRTTLSINTVMSTTDKINIKGYAPTGTYKIYVEIIAENGINRTLYVTMSSNPNVYSFSPSISKTLFNNYSGSYTINLSAYNSNNNLITRYSTSRNIS